MSQYSEMGDKTLWEMAAAADVAKENLTPVRRNALRTLANGYRGEVLSSLFTTGCFLTIVNTGA